METYETGSFLGELTYKMDSKMRVVYPLYDEDDSQPIYLLINAKQNVYDRCILCMNTEQFKRYYERLVKIPKGTPARELVKHILASVTKVTPDKAGKLLIPRHLKEYAGLSDSVTSVTYRVTDESTELWSSDRLEEKRNNDFADAEAYKLLTRYMSDESDDLANIDKYNQIKSLLERKLDILELESKCNALLRERDGE